MPLEDDLFRAEDDAIRRAVEALSFSVEVSESDEGRARVRYFGAASCTLQIGFLRMRLRLGISTCRI